MYTICSYVNTWDEYAVVFSTFCPDILREANADVANTEFGEISGAPAFRLTP